MSLFANATRESAALHHAQFAACPPAMLIGLPQLQSIVARSMYELAVAIKQAARQEAVRLAAQNN